MSLHDLVWLDCRGSKSHEKYLAVENICRSPYLTGIARWAGRPVKCRVSGMSPLVPVAAGRLPGTCCCIAPAYSGDGLADGWSQSNYSRRSAMDSNKPAQNIQDSFLNTARKERASITIYLLSG